MAALSFCIVFFTFSILLPSPEAREHKMWRNGLQISLFHSGLWIRIHFFRIRIQSLMLEANTDPDPDPIRIPGFNDQKLKKNYNWKFFLYFFLLKNCNLPIPKDSIKYVQIIEEAFSSHKRPSNTSKHELLQIIVYFSGSFLPSWIRIRIPNTDPDPQPWFHWRIGTAKAIIMFILDHDPGSRSWFFTHSISRIQG